MNSTAGGGGKASSSSSQTVAAQNGSSTACDEMTAPTAATASRRIGLPNQCSITITHSSNNVPLNIPCASGKGDLRIAPPLSVMPISMLMPVKPKTGGASVTASLGTIQTGVQHQQQQQQQHSILPSALSITNNLVSSRKPPATNVSTASINPQQRHRTSLGVIPKINQIKAALPSNVANSITITAKPMHGPSRTMLNGSTMISNAVAAAKASSQHAAAVVASASVTMASGIPPGTTITKISTPGPFQRHFSVKATATPASGSAAVAALAAVKAQTVCSTAVSTGTKQPGAMTTGPKQPAAVPTSIFIMDGKLQTKTAPAQFTFVNQFMSANRNTAPPPLVLPNVTQQGNRLGVTTTTAAPAAVAAAVTDNEPKLFMVNTKTRNVSVLPSATSVGNVIRGSAMSGGFAFANQSATHDLAQFTPSTITAVGNSGNAVANVSSTGSPMINVQISNGVLSDPAGPIQLLSCNRTDISGFAAPPKIAPSGISSAPQSPQSSPQQKSLLLERKSPISRRPTIPIPRSPRLQNRSRSLLVAPIGHAKVKRPRPYRLPSEPSRLAILMKESLAAKQTSKVTVGATAASPAPVPMITDATESAANASTPPKVINIETNNLSNICDSLFDSLECSEQMDDKSSVASSNISPERAETNSGKSPATVTTTTSNDIPASRPKDVINVIKWHNGVGYITMSQMVFLTNEFLLVQPAKRTAHRINMNFERRVNDEANLKILQARKSLKIDSLPSLSAASAQRKRDRRMRPYRPILPAFQGQSCNIPTTTTGTTGQNGGGGLINVGESVSFSWDSVLMKANVVAAPANLFVNAFPSSGNGFEVGMKLEAIDPQNNSRFCVCTIVQIIGYRLRLNFDGFSMMYAFWCNADSPDIFPPGWCAKTGRALMAPPGAPEPFDWHCYLAQTNSLAAPRTLFTHLNTQTLGNPFRCGMKLEADDLRNTRKLCVATVGDVLDSRILVTFDGYDERFDYWTDIRSPYIHPVNWHKQNGFNITVPPGFMVPFNWGTYQIATNALLARPADIQTRPRIEFAVGMKVEVVDKKNPQLIRPATVVNVDDYEVKVLFDGWPERYAFWLADDHPDLHPVYWCERTGHPLESPPTANYQGQPNGCSSYGCRSLGHANDPTAATHSANVDCPYYVKNWDFDNKDQPNRIQAKANERSRMRDRCTLQVTGKAHQRNVRGVSLLQPDVVNSNRVNRLSMSDKLENDEATSSVQQRVHTDTAESQGSAVSQPAEAIDVSDLKSEQNNSEDSSDHSSSNTDSTATTVAASDSPPLLKCKKADEFELAAKRLQASQHILHDYLPTLAGTYTLWRRNARNLFRHMPDGEQCLSNSNPAEWSVEEVAKMVSLLPGCAMLGERFAEHEIDGRALLSLSQNDLRETALRLRHGHAVKVYNFIAMLREELNVKWLLP